MALAHTSISPGTAGKSETHTVKRNYVPIKPAFRPSSPKPSTREPSPPNGIHIHTRATLNAGRKRLVSSKSSDAQKRRRMASQNAVHAASAAHHTKSEPAASSSSSRSSLCVKSTPHSATPMSSNPANLSASNGALDTLCSQTSFDLSTAPSGSGTPNMLDDAFMSPPTPVSISESPQSFSMASIMDTTSDRVTGSPATIDPVCMVMDDSFGFNSEASLAHSVPMPASGAASTVPDSMGMSTLNAIDMAPNSTATRPDIIDSQTSTPPDSQMNPFSSNSGSTVANPGSEAAFDDFSDFYFRAYTNTNVGGSANDDVVSNFAETTSDTQQAGAADTEKVETGNEFSILDYLAPTNDLF